MKFRRFIPFGEWLPDSVDRDNMALESANNLLPVFNSYRTLKAKQVISATDLGNVRVNNFKVHFYTANRSNQFAVPVDNGGNSAGNWVSRPDSADAVWEPIDNLGANDSAFIAVGGAPSAEECTIKLSNLLTPSAGDRTIKYRYFISGVSGTWTLDFTVNQPADGSVYTETKQETGTADTGEWIEGEFILTGTASVTDWNDLWVKIKATVPGAGIQEFYPSSDIRNPGSWVNDVGGSSNLYQSIGASGTPDTTYIEGPALGEGEGSYVEFELSNPADPYTSSGHVLNWRHLATNNNTDLIVGLYDSETKIAEKVVTDVPTTFTADSFTLTAGEVGSIDDYSNLSVRIQASVSDDSTPTETTDSYPDADSISSGTWSKTGATFFGSIGDNTDTIANTSASANDFYRFSLPTTLSDPGHDAGHKIRVEAKSNSAGSTLRLVLRQGNRVIKSQDFTMTASLAFYEYELTASEASGITNWGNLRLAVNPKSADQFTIRRLYFRVSNARRVRISQIKLEMPDPAYASVSMFNLETPTGFTESVGDIVELYAGTKTKLWKVDDSGFSDVSKAALYAQGTDVPSTWDFESWGDKIIATNFIDPVQIKGPSDTLFSDMISGTHKPQAKFVTSVGNFIVLGKIKFTAGGGQPEGEFDEVWWSGFEDSSDFDPSPVTQSDRQRLLSTPGEVTGMAGGEYGVIFKRTSIYRMDYVGADLRFLFRIISLNEGTRYFRSIVPVGNDIYFYGNGSFRVIRNGESLDPVPVGSGKITKTIADAEYEERAIRVLDNIDQIEKDSLVVGGYDKLSGLIFWLIRGSTDEAFRHSRILLYNIAENRFGYINASINASAIASKPVSEDSRKDIVRNLIGIGWEPSDFDVPRAEYFVFNQNVTYSFDAISKIISTKALLGDDISNQNITINRIRIIFSPEPETSNPDLSIRIEGCEEPLMQVNVQSDTVGRAEEDEDRMRPVNHITGSYFRFTISGPLLQGASSVKEISGIEIEGETHGEF